MATPGRHRAGGKPRKGVVVREGVSDGRSRVGFEGTELGKGLLAKGSGLWGWLVGGGEGRRGRPTPVPSPAPGRTRPVLGDSLYQ